MQGRAGTRTLRAYTERKDSVHRVQQTHPQHARGRSQPHTGTCSSHTETPPPSAGRQHSTHLGRGLGQGSRREGSQGTQREGSREAGHLHTQRHNITGNQNRCWERTRRQCPSTKLANKKKSYNRTQRDKAAAKRSGLCVTWVACGRGTCSGQEHERRVPHTDDRTCARRQQGRVGATHQQG